MAIASRRPADLRLVRTADPFDDDVIDLDVATLIIIDHPDDARLTGDEFTIVHSVCVSDGAGVAQTLAMPTASTGLLVQFAADATLQDRSAALAMAGAHQVETVHTRSAESGELVLIELGIQATVALVDTLSTLPGVASVEMNHALGLQAVANDSLFVSGNMWGMYGDLSAPANGFGSQAAEAWAAGNTGKSTIVIGDVDSGLEYTHPDLNLNVWLNQGELPKTLALVDLDHDGLITFRDLNQSANAAFVADRNANGRIDAGDLLADSRWADLFDQDTNGFVDDLIGWDFVNNDNNPYDDNGHGTHTAGTIGAIGGNATGVAGVNWSVQIMPLKFLDASGSGTLANAIKALDYYTAASALDQAKQWASEFIATNNSWGGGGFSSALQAAIVRGARQDVLFIAAAGNGGTDQRSDNNDTVANYPSNYSTVSGAGYEAVVAVAALTNTGALASFSNYGPQTVDLGAPGVGIFSTVPGGYASFSGTSMATPHVTGALALYASLHPEFSASQLRDALLNSTPATASLAGKTVTGGRLDVGTLVNGSLQTQSLPDLVIGSLAFDGVASVVHFQLGNNGTVDVSNVASSLYLSADAAVTTADLLLGTVTATTVSAGSQLAESLSVALSAQSVAGTYFLGAIADPGGTISEASETNNVSGLSLVILGTGAGETLTGTQVGDTLIGFAGDDTINGGGGIDVMIGGVGNDSYVVDQQIDVVLEAANEGADTVLSSAALYALPVNVENLTLAIGSAAVTGAGNTAANVLLGNQSANTLVGLDGNDTLDGGPGADVLLGGRGNDLYRVDDSLDLVDEGSAFPGYPGGAADVDTIDSAASWFWDVYSVGEILQVDASNTAGTTTIIGSMFSNQMIGNAGSNVLYGRGGSDTYRAGDGIDYISLSTLGLTDANAYVGVDGNNLIIVDKRTTGPTSYDIVYEFDVLKDRIDVKSYGYTNAAQVLATGHNDDAGNCYFALGDGRDYVYLVGITLGQVTAADFVV